MEIRKHNLEEDRNHSKLSMLIKKWDVYEPKAVLWVNSYTERDRKACDEFFWLTKRWIEICRHSHWYIRISFNRLWYRNTSFSVQGANVMWVTINQLIKSIWFLPIRDAWDVGRSPQLYVRDIVQLHWISIDIVSNEMRDFKPISGKYFTKPLKPIKFE